LIWQVTKVEHCDVHGTKLISECTNCEGNFPYVWDNMHSFICPHCMKDIRGMGERNLALVNVKSNVQTDWEFLLDPNVSIVRTFGQLSKDQSLALVILYSWALWEGGNRDFKYSPGYSQLTQDAKRIREFVLCGDPYYRPGLQIVLKFLNRVILRIRNLTNILVPDSFYDDLKKSKSIYKYAVGLVWDKVI
jgi:hypothetical protein